MPLTDERCVPCRSGTPPLGADEIAPLSAEIGAAWAVVNNHHLHRSYSFANFADALAFVNRVGALADEQDHHPDVALAWGKVELTIFTHSCGGLTRSDFVLAAKINAL